MIACFSNVILPQHLVLWYGACVLPNSDIDFKNRKSWTVAAIEANKSWRNVRTDQIWPSLIAFDTFIKRRTFMNQHLDVKEAKEYMDIYKYLDHDKDAILPVYKNK